MFFKNYANQHVPCQMNSRSDGAPITSGVSIAVKVDSSAPGAGGGTLTHIADGYWDYIPTQAETNGDVLAFSFTYATGINQVVGIITREPNVPVDMQTIKGQSVACASGVTVLASVGTATASTAQTGDAYGRIGESGAGLTALGDARIAYLDASVLSRLAPSGTLATVTNLTNAPTSGDLTATMKDSVTTAATAATPSVASVTAGVIVTTNNDKAGYSLVTSGTGSTPVDIFTTVGGNPKDGVSVWVTTDPGGNSISAGVLISDAFGKTSFLLDHGTYYVWRQQSGVNFINPTICTVV